MTLFLDRVDAAPIQNSTFDMEFTQWLGVLVETLNEDIQDIQGAILSNTVVTGTTQTVDINSIYIPTNAGLTTFQLPNIMSVGAQVTIAGQGAGGWSLLTGVGQTIQIASTGSTANTSVSSSSRYDSINIMCVVANLTWIALTTQTTGFVIV